MQGFVQQKWTGRLAFAFCMIAPVSTQAQGRIVGSVADATNTPLALVAITLTGPGERQAQSGPDGAFAFEAVPAGEYRLEASLPGFAPTTQAVGVTAAEAVSVQLILQVRNFERLVVTAGKSGELDAQDVPMAVSVLPGAELERLQVRSVEDLAALAPSVTFSQNTGFAQLTIRGIGTNAVFAGSDPSSAVYFDGVYLARPAMVLADFMDIERVEVLRGPQGTLYGRNAVGGALNVITKTPTDELEAAARASVGDYGTLRAEGRLAGAIVPRRVAASLAVSRGVQQGFVRDLEHPDHPLGGEDVMAARGKLRVGLGARGDLLVSADVTHQDPRPLTYAKVLAVKPGFEIDNPAGPRDVRTSTLGESRNLQYGVAARLALELTPQTTLTSLTAYRKLDYDVFVDTDITELELVVTDLREMQHQWSQELTLAGRHSGMTWVGGLFLLHDDDHQPTSLFLGGPGVENRFDPRVEASTGALFGQATLSLTRGLNATAGLRSTRERKTFDTALAQFPLGQPENPVPGVGYAFTDAISHSAWTPKLGLELLFGERTLAYASATRGFKSGGFNATSPVAGRGYAPEWAWSYEAGLKHTFDGGRINVAAFHTDYKDLQVQTTLQPGVIDISNAAEATIRGVELEGAWQPARALQLGGHLAWLDARYDAYEAIGVGVAGDVSGNRLNNAPEWSGRVWLEWKARAGRAGMLSIRADSCFQSVVFYTPFNDRVQRQIGYGLLDLSAELGPGRWSVGLHARNLTGEDFITGSFASPPPAVGGRPGPPRQLAIQLALRR